MTHQENSAPQPEPHQPADSQGIRLIMTAVIQLQDLDKASHALEEAGLAFTHLSSTGGFLGRRNATLLIGLRPGQEEQAVTILRKTCRRRVEYISMPLEGSPYQMPLSTPVNVGGATIFVLPVERYEEIQ